MLLTDDYPHRVPTRAWLRWRENWLYFLVDVERNVFVTAHMSLQPTYGIARYACNLIIDGERSSFAEEVPCPENFANTKTLTLGQLKVDFIAPHQRIDVRFDGPKHTVAMTLESKLPLFDYADCVDTNPDDFSLAESTSAGFGVFRHHNQTMQGKGTLSYKDGSPARSLQGVGYRDHSWGMRDDTMTNEHIWAWASFPESTVHVTRVVTRLRPSLWVSEGYVGHRSGNLALAQCSATYSGSSADDLPGTVRLAGQDPFGNSVFVTCDLTKAFARNRFLSQHPGVQGYLMKHTFCPALREDTGEQGVAMVEIGAIQKATDARLSQGR